MSNNDVVVYYKPGCPFGVKLRVVMTLAGIPYTAIRFRDDEVEAAKVRDVSDGNSPTVRIGQCYLSNPSLREVRAARAP